MIFAVRGESDPVAWVARRLEVLPKPAYNYGQFAVDRVGSLELEGSGDLTDSATLTEVVSHEEEDETNLL